MADRTIIVMPARNAEKTLEATYRKIPAGCFDEIILVDDRSEDATAEVARNLGLTVLRHDRNTGYGGNQKTCYDAALSSGADIVVMLHPDDQYDGRMVPAALDVLRLGICDVVLGNRIRTRREALSGGMPIPKYLANRVLTLLENVLTGQNLGEWHSGFRAYTRRVLETVPYRRNSDGFVFDSQFLLQSIHFGFRVGDLPVPVRYFAEASSIDYRSSFRYAVLTLWTFVRWYGHRLGLVHCPLFDAS